MNIRYMAYKYNKNIFLFFYAISFGTVLYVFVAVAFSFQGRAKDLSAPRYKV